MFDRMGKFPPEYRETRYMLEPLHVGVSRVFVQGDEENDRLIEDLNKMPQVKNTLKLYTRLEHTMRAMVMNLTAWILRDSNKHETGTKTVTETLALPETWWDMLKQHPKFPKWFVKRYPPKVITKSFDFTVNFEKEIRVCPHADIEFRDPMHMYFMAFETPSGPIKIPPEVIAADGFIHVEVYGDTTCDQKRHLQGFSGEMVIYPTFNRARVKILLEHADKAIRWLNSQSDLHYEIVMPDVVKAKKEKETFPIHDGVPCPKCDVGTDTNGDGDCLFCGGHNISMRKDLLPK